MIYNVIRTANPSPFSAKFIYVGVKIIKLNKSDVERYIEYVHSVVVYEKYVTRLEGMIIFSPRL